MTAVSEQESPAESRKRGARTRKPLGDNVARTIARLQTRLLAPTPHQEAIAVLARLRRGIGRVPGFDYTLDRYLAVPDDLVGDWLRFDEPSDTEHAKHVAVTHYALHQQSQREQMHVDGRGLGRAIADLARLSGGPEGVRRRFAALGTAISFDETLYHLRSLIVMLREHRIPLDYGLLADDLRTLRQPGGRERMQAAWGREFFRTRANDTESGSETDTNEETLP